MIVGVFLCYFLLFSLYMNHFTPSKVMKPLRSKGLTENERNWESVTEEERQEKEQNSWREKLSIDTVFRFS